MTRRECEKSRQHRDWNRDKVKKDVLWLSFKGIINEFEMDVFGTHTHTHAMHTHTHRQRSRETNWSHHFGALYFRAWDRALKMLYFMWLMLLWYWGIYVCVCVYAFAKGRFVSLSVKYFIMHQLIVHVELKKSSFYITN